MQKQAVLVCSVCALAAILTIAITMTLLKRGKTPAAPGEQPSSEVLVPGEEDISDHYQISETSAALLPETADAGESYQKETLFLGDSNTVRLYANGLISLQQFCAKEGIGTHAALNEGIVTFKKDSSTYTIAQAVAKMKPRRVVIMLGTNDTGMSVDEFIKNYTALVQAIQESYPYTDIIVNTVPPVPANHANYPHMDQTKIDDFNMALLSMCEQMGLKFLNSAEALKDANGYGREDYYQTGDIHLKPVGLKAMLSYLRTHAYQTDDRRPDTANIPTRAEYTPNPSSAVTAPSSSEAAGSSEEQGVLYQASYRVDKTGGTLSSGSDSGKTSLSYEVTSAAQSISVTAVPEDGYVFVKWSDGVTQKTRTDTNFKQNVDVTAVFAAASVHISSTGKAVLGDSYTFTAKLGGKHLTADSIRWYANGAEVPQAAGKTTVRLHTGDPCLYGAIREQMDALDADGIPYDDTPGVSSFCGAAAALRAEYTLPNVSQTVIITRTAGRTPVPERESIRSLAAHQATMVLFLSTALTETLQGELLAGGYAAETPAAIVYKATWPEEKIFRCAVGTLHKTVTENGMKKTALIVVGGCLGDEYLRSLLYHPDFTTEYRKGKA